MSHKICRPGESPKKGNCLRGEDILHVFSKKRTRKRGGKNKIALLRKRNVAGENLIAVGF